MTYSSAARWIWTGGEPSPRNSWLRARRAFRAPGTIHRAALLITADSRYKLSVNGVELGEGPVRSFPWAQSYDCYDVASLLRPGCENVLAVRVVHWGDQTMQYVCGRGGLLCELVLTDSDGIETHVTGAAGWRVSRDAAFAQAAPRISVQLPFEEHYDARHEEPEWQDPAFDAQHWQQAVEIGPPGCPPWTGLERRSTPFLTLDPVSPSRVLAVDVARPRAGTWWSLDLRHLAGTSVSMLSNAPPGEKQHALVTELVATAPCTVGLWATWNYEPGTIWLRGNNVLADAMALQGDPLQVSMQLEAGPNLLVVAGSQRPTLHVEHDGQVHVTAEHLLPPAARAGAAWAYLGPLDERSDGLARVCHSRTSAELPEDMRRVPVGADATLTDIFALTASQRHFAVEGGFSAPEIAGPTPLPFVAGTRPRPVDLSAALLHQSADAAAIQPQPDGDVHLVVDFGRELVGYLEFELDAPAGTVVDVNCFEGIDESGIFWTWGLRNSFRYTCREGEQRFRSHVRRGFRYISLTFREHQRPVHLRWLRCLLSTYPVEERGQFACSDALLTKIWQVAAYTVRLCMLDTYVDCPAYEQVFWVGDARNSALVNAVAFGAYDLTDRCLRLVGQSLSRNLDVLKSPALHGRAHLTTDHVVSGWFSEIPMWTFLWIWNAWEHYWLTGDIEALAAHYEPVHECLDRALSFLNDRDLLDIPDVWNLVDWAAMDLPRTGEVTANSAMLVAAQRRAATMSETLGRPEHATYHAAADRAQEAINRYCWNELRGAYVDTVRDATAYERYAVTAAQTGVPVESPEQFAAHERISEPTNTLVVLCQCAPPERLARVAPLVRAAREGKFVSSSPAEADAWPADHIVPVGSPWFLFFTLEALVTLGDAETALQLLREQWARMLDKGATTFWETFPGQVGSGHWSRSLCHGWSAAPAYFLSTLVLGVRPLAPGYTRVAIAPEPPEAVSWARGVVPSPLGDISVGWERDATGTWTLMTTVPKGVVAEVSLPGTAARSPRISGLGTEAATWTGTRWRVDVVGGVDVQITTSRE